MRLYVFTLLIILSLSVLGQEQPMYGARSEGMGNASVAIADFWSVFSNQAGLTSLSCIALGATFQNQFLQKEMTSIGLGVAVPIKKVGVISFSCNRFGYHAYNQTFAGIAISRKFFHSLSAALKIDYINTQIGNNYGNKHLVTFELGLMYQLNKVNIGFHIYNPIRVKIDPISNERLEANYKLGVVYMPIPKIVTSAEFEKITNNTAINIKFGVEYQIIKELVCRAGFESLTKSYCFGIGTYFYNFNLDIATKIHQYIGLTSQLSITYHFVR